MAAASHTTAQTDQGGITNRLRALGYRAGGPVRMAQSTAVKTIGRALVAVALVVVILNQVFTIDIINNSTGPFSGLITTVENIGGAAITLTVVGLLVLGGAIAMGFMDRF